MTVTKQDEIELNSQKYRIKGAVKGAWLDPFPESIAIGDADYANRRDLSSWIMNDFRGGIGVEEMDEKVDLNKCWWTNCIIQYRNHILPPRLATAWLQIHKVQDVTQTIAAADATDQATINTLLNEIKTDYNTHIASTTYHVAADATNTVTSDNSSSEATAVTLANEIKTDYNAHRSQSGVHNNSDTGNQVTTANCTNLATAITLANEIKVDFNLHLLSGISVVDSGGGTIFCNFNDKLYAARGKKLIVLSSDRTRWNDVKTDFTSIITALVPSLNSKLYIFLGGTSVAGDSLVDSDDAEDSSTSETYAKVAELTCLGSGTFRIKFDLKRDAGAAGTAYAKIYRNGVAVGAEATNATSTYATSSEDIGGWTGGDLIQLYIHRDAGGTTTAWSKNFRIYGTAEKYWYMTTAEAFTQSLTGGKWSIQYDAKLFKAFSNGTVKYSTDPDGTTPTWSSGGAINDIASQIQGFQIGRDASGAYELYVPTKSILKAYDSATPQWIDTEAVLPNHPIGGQGHAYWNGKLYFSYGLAVKEYYPETGAFIDVGLTERDGLPAEYNGEIVKLLGDTGVKGMFAAIDASITSGNSMSGLYLYDGNGWQCWWVDVYGTYNEAMHDIIVSSASSGYAVYWDCGDTIYYIDIPRGIENPDKISQNYATVGYFFSSWYDAGNPVAAKLAKVLADFAKGITSSENVYIYYRLDHTYTDFATGWGTALAILDTTGESGYKENLFASGAGISFKAIQFRLDFVTPGSTAKPDIQSLVFYHKKRTGSEKLRTWAVTVICDDYGLTTAKEKVANLKSAIESTTDVLFSYHPNDASTEQYYVTVNCPSFSEQAGRDYDANYELQLIES